VFTLGRHLIAEYYDCDAILLNDPERIRVLLEQAVTRIGATLLAVHAHHYAPQGVTATAIIAESHLSIHTWPEHGYAAVDIFTCGDLDPRPGFTALQEALSARSARVQVILRGTDDHVQAGHPLEPADVVVLSKLAPLVRAGDDSAG
jgi:S-adenosylmethionine decarboxylase